MAESAVSFLLDKLSALLQEKRQLLGGLEREVESIQYELGQMRGFLRDAEAKEETYPNLKGWITQIQEISFEVEDALDKYMLRFGARARRGTRGLSGCMKRLYVFIKDLRARDQIAHEIQAIKYRLEDVAKIQQRHREMYGVIDQGSSSGTANDEWCYGRGEALLLEDDEVVGIEEPKQQLLTWIKSADEGFDVIAVVGMGGLGKTTLVKKVFDDEYVKSHFNKHVWIVASDYKDVREFLKSLIVKLREENKKLVAETKELPPQGLEDMDADEMGNLVYDILKVTKYIVVVDDIWHISRWEAIRFAFPKRGSHGCVIITTRFSSIADAACSQSHHVYNLKPLSPDKSKALFDKKAFPRNPCPPYLTEFAENILNKCEGLPLAIVVVGGLLATKNNRIEEWERFSRSIIIDEVEGGRLRKLLSLSYNDKVEGGRNAIGSLQCLTLTRPDIVLTVNRLDQAMSAHHVSDWGFVKRLFRYLKGTLHFGLLLRRSHNLSITTYSNSDFGGDTRDGNSTSAYLIFLGSNPIYWHSRKKTGVARSSTEAEYRALAFAALEVCWITHLYRDLGLPILAVPWLLCDNM